MSRLVDSDQVEWGVNVYTPEKTAGLITEKWWQRKTGLAGFLLGLGPFSGAFDVSFTWMSQEVSKWTINYL